MNLKEELLRIIIKSIYIPKVKFEIEYENFDPERMDSYILIANHQSNHDAIMTSMFLRKPPIPVVNTFVLTNDMYRFLLTKIYDSISKRKGQSDLTTVRHMMKTLKDGRGVYLFPEGNSSFFGEQSEIPYSTFKFIKKMKTDVVMCRIDGAFLTMPRWGYKITRRGLVKLKYYTLFKGEELKDMTTDEIYEKVKEAMRFNDFDWNRERKYLYNPKKRALGLELYIYYCPKCKQIQTIYTKNNEIYCSDCGEIAHFNEYSLIEGLDFDNLVDWSHQQQKQLSKISGDLINTSGVMYIKDTINFTSLKIGKVYAKLKDQELYVQHRQKEYSFNLGNIEDLALTRKDEISFDYGDKTYFIKMKDPMLFYDVINYKIGG